MVLTSEAVCMVYPQVRPHASTASVRRALYVLQTRYEVQRPNRSGFWFDFRGRYAPHRPPARRLGCVKAEARDSHGKLTRELYSRQSNKTTKGVDNPPKTPRKTIQINQINVYTTTLVRVREALLEIYNGVGALESGGGYFGMCCKRDLCVAIDGLFG